MNCLSYDEMFPLFDHWLSNKKATSHSLAVINVHICVTALNNKSLRDIYNSVDLAGIDSKPFLFWARAFYKRNSDRFYAPDLMLQVCGREGGKSYRHFLYGGYPGAPERIEGYLRNRFPQLEVVGKYSPPFRDLDQEEEQAICEMINDSAPDFVWVGLGSPKQDIWIHRQRQRLRGCILIPSGATFDFFSGRIRQAPKWIREAGFEWLYRLTQDFQRLWIRYTVYNVAFVLVFIFQLIKVISFDKQGYLVVLGRRTRFGNV